MVSLAKFSRGAVKGKELFLSSYNLDFSAFVGTAGRAYAVTHFGSTAAFTGYELCGVQFFMCTAFTLTRSATAPLGIWHGSISIYGTIPLKGRGNVGRGCSEVKREKQARMEKLFPVRLDNPREDAPGVLAPLGKGLGEFTLQVLISGGSYLNIHQNDQSCQQPT